MIVYDAESDRVERARSKLLRAKIVDRVVEAVRHKRSVVVMVHENCDDVTGIVSYSVYFDEASRDGAMTGDVSGAPPALYFGVLVYVEDAADVRADLALWLAQYEVYFDPALTLKIDMTHAPKLTP